MIAAFARCLLSNDLFPAAAALQPQVAAAAKALHSITATAATRQQQQQTGLHASGLTGSGAALIGIGTAATAAADVRAVAAALRLCAYKCSPLYKRQLSSQVYVHPIPAAAAAAATEDEASAAGQQQEVRHLWFAPRELAERLQ